MKILIVTDNYYPNVNGSSYFTQRLAYYLKQRGHEILVMTASRSLRHEPAKHDDIDIFGLRSYPVFLYKDFRISLPFGIRNAIERAMKRFSPDVIHIQDHFVISPVVQKIAKEMSVPMIGTNHFMPENITHYLHLPNKLDQLVKNWAWRQFRKVYDKLDYVTTPTKTAASLLKQVNLTKEVIVVSNGIDLKKFHPNHNGDYLKKRFNLPNVPILLYVGRLDKEKNIDTVIRALPAVLKKINIHFLVGGKGAETEKLKKLTAELHLEKSVTFAGFVPDEDLPSLYNVADCFVIAGTAELQSLVTMEAMASQLPVVAVNAMALPELVRHGENGFLFEHNDTASLATHLINIFSDDTLREQMSQKSLEIIQEHDIDKTMSKFESLYHEIIHRSA